MPDETTSLAASTPAPELKESFTPTGESTPDGRPIYRLVLMELYQRSGKTTEYVPVSPTRGPQGPRPQ